MYIQGAHRACFIVLQDGNERLNGNDIRRHESVMKMHLRGILTGRGEGGGGVFRAWRFDKSGLRLTLITRDLYRTLHYRAEGELRRRSPTLHAARSAMCTCTRVARINADDGGGRAGGERGRGERNGEGRVRQSSLWNANPREQQVQGEKKREKRGSHGRKVATRAGDTLLEKCTAAARRAP